MDTFRPGSEHQPHKDSDPRTNAAPPRDGAELARLREDNDDLRASAYHWRRLYEGALQRAHTLEEALERSDQDRPLAADGWIHQTRQRR